MINYLTQKRKIHRSDIFMEETVRNIVTFLLTPHEFRDIISLIQITNYERR